MKKSILLIVLSLVLYGCAKKPGDQDMTPSTTNGPPVPEDEATDEEKTLRMIQECIDDYNNGLIAEREEYFQIVIPSLPLEVGSLPQISSLKDLTQIEEEYSNAEFIGTQALDDKYTVVYRVYRPTNGSFWANGSIEFRIDPEKVTKDDSRFTEYRNALYWLLPNGSAALNYLHGLDVNLAEDTEDGIYHEVLSIGDTDIHSIEGLRAYAERFYDRTFLEARYYPTSFHSALPVYKEEGGKLFCIESEVTSAFTPDYEPAYIIAASEDSGTVTLNLLTSVMDVLQPQVKEVIIRRTADGFILPGEMH